MDETLQPSDQDQEFFPNNDINPEAKKMETLKLDLSCIIRTQNYQISDKNIQAAIKDPSWEDQSYVWMDPYIYKIISQNKDKTNILAYILDQRAFYDKNNIKFKRKMSDLFSLELKLGYIEDDDVLMHEFGMFSIPFYFQKIEGSLLFLGGIVPKNKLKIKHQSPGNQIKAHTQQDLLFLSYINPIEFKSVVTPIKLAAHKLYMILNRGISGYVRPNWLMTTKKRFHKATLLYDASYEDIINAMELTLTDSNGNFNRAKYTTIIFDCKVKKKYDHFDGNEVCKWRKDQHYNLHAHKFPLDLSKMEDYETLSYLYHRKRAIGRLNKREEEGLKNLMKSKKMAKAIIINVPESRR